MNDYYRREGNEFEIVAKILAPFLLLVLVFVPILLVPEWRFAVTIGLLKLRLLETKVLGFSGEHLALLDLLAEVKSLGPEGLTPGLFFKALRLGQTLSYKAGVAVTAIFSVLTLALAVYLLFFRERSKDVMAPIKEYKKASVEEILSRHGMPSLPGDPLEAARIFAEVRKKKNVPPNIIARKLFEKDPVLGISVWWYNRVVGSREPEVMWPVTTSRELREILSSMIESSTETVSRTEIQKKVEAAIQRMGG